MTKEKEKSTNNAKTNSLHMRASHTKRYTSHHRSSTDFLDLQYVFCHPKSEMHQSKIGRGQKEMVLNSSPRNITEAENLSKRIIPRGSQERKMTYKIHPQRFIDTEHSADPNQAII